MLQNFFPMAGCGILGHNMKTADKGNAEILALKQTGFLHANTGTIKENQMTVMQQAI